MLFQEIIDKVFVMPIIKHINDSSIPSVIDNSIRIHSTFTSRSNHEKHYDLKHRKYYVKAEYLENERASIFKRYGRH